MKNFFVLHLSQVVVVVLKQGIWIVNFFIY